MSRHTARVPLRMPNLLLVPKETAQMTNARNKAGQIRAMIDLTHKEFSWYIVSSMTASAFLAVSARRSGGQLRPSERLRFCEAQLSFC